MNLKQINNLTELFFDQFNKQIDKNKILLSTLGDKRKNYSWQETYDFINLVSNELRKVISKGDRCLLISENRPEWFIADLSIMLSDGITVPAYTTYAERDYEYIINAYPHLKTDLDEVYQKTKFTSWFRNQRPELFEEMQHKLANRARNRRARNRPRQRQNGEYRIGLNDMLKLEAVSYPGRSYVGIGGSANAIRKVRERYEKTGKNSRY